MSAFGNVDAQVGLFVIGLIVLLPAGMMRSEGRKVHIVHWLAGVFCLAPGALNLLIRAWLG